jgi:hypothetical protein
MKQYILIQIFRISYANIFMGLFRCLMTKNMEKIITLLDRNFSYIAIMMFLILS